MPDYSKYTNKQLHDELRAANTLQAEALARVFRLAVDAEGDETTYMLRFLVVRPDPAPQIRARREVWARNERQARAKLKADLSVEYPSATEITVFSRKKAVLK